MNEGDMVLTRIAQADGVIKGRPALLLRELPPFGDFLVCGVSRQIRQAVPEFDEIIRSSDGDFVTSGLVADSVIRLGFLGVVPRTRIVGTIGSPSRERHARPLSRLNRHLVSDIGETINNRDGPS